MTVWTLLPSGRSLPSATIISLVGTQIVWDVDVFREEVVRVHRVSEPDNPALYDRGQLAGAEPAVPGWTMPVEDLFHYTP